MTSETLQHSPAPALNLRLALCGEEGLKFGGQLFKPDLTKGYFQFALSHAFPVATVYGQALHPNVIAKNYQSLLHQNINYEHQLAFYHQGERDVRDRVIGSIMAVDFPQTPGGWKVQSDPERAPGITGVGVLYKQTQGMARVLGEQLTGRRNYTVSMEVLWPLLPGEDESNPKSEAGFAVARAGKKPLFEETTPPDLAAMGHDFVPASQAPEELLATYSRKKARIVAQYKGRKVYVMMGGLDHPVHYAGLAVVQFGAEAPAKISRLAASGVNPLDTLADALGRIFSPKLRKGLDS